MRFPYRVTLTTPDGTEHIVAYRSSESKAEQHADAIRESLGSGKTADGFIVSVESR